MTPEGRDRSSDLRQRILDEAIGIVYSQGTERVTMRALGEKLGYSPATIYLYFRNKEDLLLAIARYGFEKLARRCLPPLRRGGVVDALRESAHAYLDFAFENAALYQLMFRVLPPAHEAPDAFPEAIELGLATHALYERGRREGLLRDLDVDVLEGIFTSALHGFLDLALTHRLPRAPSRWSRKELRGELVETMLAAIAAPR